MDWLDKIKSFGKTILSSVPGGEVLVNVANQFLPDDQKISKKSTTEDLLKIYQSLDKSQQAKFDKQAEIELAQITASVDKLQTMVSVESASGNTRPFIAKLFAIATVSIVLLITIALFIATVKSDQAMVKELTGLWQLVLGIITPFLIVIRHYFGVRTSEKKARYHVVTGVPVSQQSALNAIIAKITK